MNLTRKDFEAIIEDTEKVIDYEYILLLIIENHYKKGNSFKEEGKTSLYQSEYEKASRIMDLMQAYHKYNKLTEEEQWNLW